MAQERLGIYIDGDARGFTNAVGQAHTSLSGLLKIMGMGALAGGGIALATQGFRLLEKGVDSVIDTFKECITEASGQEESLIRLNAVLKATNQYTIENSQALIDNSMALQEKTTFTDEEVRAAEAQLAIYKLTTSQIIDATAVIADMAAATGQDLTSATTLVGKAMEGITTPLRRYGIILDETRLKAEGSSYVLEELRSRFSGVAEEMAGTFSGRLTQAKNQIGELKEVVGTAFLPVLTNMLDKFLHGSDIIDNFGRVVGKTESPLSRLQDWAGRTATKIKDFLDALMGADWSGAIKGLKEVASALEVLITGGQSFGSAEEKAQGFADAIGKVSESLASFLIAIRWTIDAVKVLGGIIDLLVVGPLETWRKFNESWKLSMDGNVEAIKEFQQEGLSYGEQIDAISNRINNMKNYVNDFGVVTEETTYKMDGFMSSLALATGTTDTLSTSVGSLGGEIDSTDAEAASLKTTLDLLSPAEVTAEDKTQKLKEVLGNMAKVTMESVGQAIELKRAIDALESKTITITTMYLSREAYYGGKTNTGNTLSGAQQSGGLIKNNMFSSDLNIPLVRGEAVLPAPVVKAIKEGNGSFAGLNMGNDGGSVSNYFNIGELVVREEADVERIAQELYTLQTSSLRGAGIR